MLSLARDYSQRRVSFGKPIAKHPLHLNTLKNMEIEVRHLLNYLGKYVNNLGRFIDLGMY